MDKRLFRKQARYLTITLFAAVMILFTLPAEAGLLKTTIIDMDPGKTYDVADAGYSTQYTISKSGEYWIKGSSEYAFVRITGGEDVTLHMKDGLTLDTSMYTYVGDAVPAMWIDDFNGTVKLSVEGGAKVKLTGYWGMPGIQKNGLKTKVIFMTDDPSNPGAVDAISSKMKMSAPGIGSSRGGDHPFGNVVFESGNWYATGTCAAGLGSSRGNSVDGITINGGHVEARHWVSPDNFPCGPGIGVTGYGGRLDNLVINGGSVKASGEDDMGGGSHVAPGIGAGYGSQVGTITINGGSVKAIAGNSNQNHMGGSGIGVSEADAYRSNSCDAIIINGGDVEARAGGVGRYENLAGIGGQPVNQVVINGGKVKGIGALLETGIEAQYVTITGGEVEAIGGGPWTEQHVATRHRGHGIRAHKELYITGGMVTATRTDLEGGNMDVSAGNIRVMGGSVDMTDINKTAVNDGGQALKRTVFNLKDLGDALVKDKAIESVTIDGIDYEYGIKDVRDNQNGKLYFWLPDSSVVKRATVEGDLYTGNVTAGQVTNDDTHDVFLSHAKKINIRRSTGTDAVGSGWIVMNETALSDMELDVAPEEGYKLDGLYLDNEKTIQVADSEGNYLKNVMRGSEQVTDGDGKWVSAEVRSNIIDFFCGTTPITYEIAFDNNIPADASTKDKASGSTDPISGVKYDEEVALKDCGCKLPGYEFTGWATEPNGKKVYEATDSVKNLCKEDGGTCTLYACWKPKTYMINLVKESGSSTTAQAQMTFDRESNLPKISELRWSKDGHSFHGWSVYGQVGSLYGDMETVYNLCTVDNDGNVQGKTLTGHWVSDGKITITATENGAGTSVLDSGGKFRIEADEGGAEYVLDTTEDPAGTYTADMPQVGAGKYHLSMDSDDYVIPLEDQTFDYDGTSGVSIVLEYYTVSMKQDDNIASAYVKHTGGTTQPTDLEHAPKGAEIGIFASANGGYHFDGYSAIGVSPEGFAPFDPGKSTQEGLKVRGEVEFTAHAEPNVYKVQFDANAAAGVTGSMEDQDMVYGEPQNLSANQFERVGATFDEWNTAADGSGDPYSDKERISNLTTGSEVTLYAQWNLKKYKLSYDLGGGQMPGGSGNPETYDVETASFTLNNPVWTDDSQEFVGWIGTDLTEPTKDVEVPEGSTGDRNYSAIFREITYHVTFNTDGGSEVDTQTLKVHQTASKPDDPTKKYFKFGGWYADKELTTEFDFGKEITEDTVVYAKWNNIPRKITYDLNGGTLGGQTGTIVVDANAGDIITIMDAPEKEGYEFKYWKGSKYYPGDEYKVEEDHTLTAVWKKDRSNDDDNGDDNGNGENGNGGSGGNGKNSGGHRGVNTSDDSSLPLWIILMGGATAGLVGMIYRRRRRRV